MRDLKHLFVSVVWKYYLWCQLLNWLSCNMRWNSLYLILKLGPFCQDFSLVLTGGSITPSLTFPSPCASRPVPTYLSVSLACRTVAPPRLSSYHFFRALLPHHLRSYIGVGDRGSRWAQRPAVVVSFPNPSHYWIWDHPPLIGIGSGRALHCSRVTNITRLVPDP
jgi:hypothetical protein